MVSIRPVRADPLALLLSRTFYIIAAMADTHPGSARERFITATEEMLRESGMSGAGIKEIVARSGAPIGSLYHYFPGGKTQLVSESLRNQADKFPRLIERFFDGRRSAAAALQAWFNTAADGFERAGADKACAVGAVTLDLAADDEEIRTICHIAFDDWTAAIAARLPFSDDRTRHAFATTIVAALEGAFILAKAAKSGQPFRDVGRCLAATLPNERRLALRRDAR